MNDLISRKALLTELRALDPPGFEDSIAGKVAIKKIKEAPAVSLNPHWIPVTERLPDNNNPVLVYCTNTTIGGGYITHIGSFNSGRYWFLRAEPGIATFPVREWQVTHWMPLPEPPKEE